VGRGAEGSGRGKHWFTIRDFLADGRCSQSVLDFLSTTDVGKLVPAEEDAGSEVSEWGLRELREREGRGEWRRRSWVPRGGTAIPPDALLCGVHGRGVRGGLRFPLFFLLLGLFSFAIPLVRVIFSWDRPGRRAKGSLHRADSGRETWMKSALPKSSCVRV